jgi:hypothetical protein
VCGLALIVASLFALNASTPFPGWAALMPVTGAAALILSKGSSTSRAFEHRAAVNVGLISYPFYLWHWPLLVFAELYKFRPLTDIQRGLLIGAALVLAWLTYELLELPIRKAGIVFVRPLGAAMAGLAIIATVPSLGFVPRLPDAIAELITVASPASAALRVHECLLVESDANDFSEGCAEKVRPLIAVWGDSTAAALVPGFRKLQETEAFGLAQFTASSCQPVIDRQSLIKHCEERNRRIIDLIRIAAPDIVLLHSLWGLNDTANELRPTIDALRAGGIARIVIVGPVPVWRGGLPKVVATHYWRTQSVLPERTPLYFDRGSGDENLRKVATILGVDYVSARNAFCNEDGCISRVGASLVASDAVHLTETGSILLAQSIFGQLHR